MNVYLILNNITTPFLTKQYESNIGVFHNSRDNLLHGFIDMFKKKNG